VRWRRTALVLLAVLLGAVAPACSPSAQHSAEARLFLPDGGTSRGLVVLVPGGGWTTADPSGLEPLARELARAGYVAATTTYRAAAQGVRYPVPVEDVLCAAASAVAQAKAKQRAVTPFVLLGHSAGGQLVLLAALRPERFRATCPDPAVTPDAAVALAGAFELGPYAEPLFGASAQERPDLWREGDVLTWVRERPRLPVLLVHGQADRLVAPEVTTRTAAALRSAGHPVRVVLLPGVNHGSVFQPQAALPVLLPWLATLTPAR
jgi:acetyl esterase/lipase